MMDRTKYAIPDIQEPEPVVCLLCGAWIVRQNVHTMWHEAEAERIIRYMHSAQRLQTFALGEK